MKQNKVLTVGRQFRKLEDLDLLDNFLFQEMLSQEEGKEFARILLSTILDKEIRKVRIMGNSLKLWSLSSCLMTHLMKTGWYILSRIAARKFHH